MGLKETLGDWYGYFNPDWRIRKLASEELERELLSSSLTSYRGARHSRVGRSSPSEGRADYHLEATYDRRDLVDRARDLERNSVIAEGLLNRACENVVGPGFGLQAQAGGEGNASSKRWNADVEKRWQDWCLRQADVRGLSTFGELLSLTYRSWLRDGDVAAIKLADGSLQFIESDQIASQLGGFPTKGEIDGVVLDRRGKPTGFRVLKDPDPQWSTVRFGQEFDLVPAKDVLFLARRQRHGQTRGLSAFANIAWLLDQIDGQIEAVTIAARMAACVGLVIRREVKTTSGISTVADSAGNQRRLHTMEPGMIAEIGRNDDITPVDPRNPAQNFPDFLATLGRLVGLTFGLPLEVAFLDFSRTNYSSARAALLQAHQVWSIHQQMLARFCSDVYLWWLIREMRAGRIPIRRDAERHSWIKPGWKWVDPEKELKAQLGAVDAGIMTLGDIAMQQGRDFEELVTARKRELDLLDANGIPVVRSTLTRDPKEPGQDQQAQ